MSSSPTFLDPVILPLIKGESVLDVACGVGRWGNLIHTNHWEAGIPCPAVDGFDSFPPNVRTCAQRGCYRRVWEHRLPASLEGTWDTVLACEIIEHLPEEEAYRTVEMLESVATKRIIISTPNFLYLRGGADTDDGHNPDEAHLSHIPRSWFKKRGYEITGAGFGNPTNPFVKAIKGCRMRGQRMLGGLPYVFPSLGFLYVAHKDVG
ncbi:MAG: class I SAM-dependent methyltransferase [Planctomycetia bacterium]|jgi:hypothetical protein